MRSTILRNAVCFTLTCCATLPAVADELSDLMPADTLIYVGWPGAERLHDAWEDTALSGMMNEPEIAHFIAAFKTMLEKATAREADSNPQIAVIADVLDALGVMWKHPAALGLFGVRIAEDGPSAELALVVKAGDANEAAAEGVNTLLEQIVAMEGELEIGEVTVGNAVLKQLATPDAPDMPLRWGVMDDRFIMTLGLKYYDFLDAGDRAKKLTTNERFAAAAQTTHATSDSPTIFMDLEGLVAQLESLQPMFASHGVPVLSEEKGLSKLLDSLGMGSLKSFSMAMAPKGEGIQSTWFLHAPGLEGGPLHTLFDAPKLTDADLAVIPRDVRFAVAGYFDLKGGAEAFMAMLEILDSNLHDNAESWLASVKESTGLSLIDDACGAFGGKWAYYDANDFGGFYITGLVFIAEPREGHDFTDLADQLLKLAKDMGEIELTRHSEPYRDTVMHYVQFEQWPIPIVPCWAEVNGRLLIALYPQMLRPAIDHMLDKGPSILDNADFIRNRKTMPRDIQGVQYIDTVAGIGGYYPILMPIGQFLQAMLRSEVGIDMPATAIPSMPAVNRHLFGNMSVTTRTPDGILGISHGALPFAIPSIGQGGMAVPMLLGIGLPSVARARGHARSAVSTSNLRQLGLSMQMHAIEHNGKLPPDLKTSADMAGASYQILVSPGDPDAPSDNSDGAYSSYEYLAGHNTDSGEVSSLVVAYEREDFDGDGRVNVLFLDSHVESMAEHRFEEFLEATKEHLGIRESENEAAGLE